MDDKWEKRINKAKKAGCRDITGWLADELYNDPDTLSDLMGDKICDETNGDEVLHNLVLDEFDKNAFPGMKKAVKNLRR